jgi:hypothetical protein
MDYLKHYHLLCNSRKQTQRCKNDDIYYERHHIQPKSFGGSDNASNLVLLTPREHYIAHLLLYKHYCHTIHPTTSSCRKMAFSLVSMKSTSDLLNKRKLIFNSRRYQDIREAAVMATKGKKIENTINYKKPKSVDHREHIRLARLSSPPRSMETRKKLKEKAQARKDVAFKNHTKTTCPACGKYGQKNAMLRWHFDNCKWSKEIINAQLA